MIELPKTIWICGVDTFESKLLDLAFSPEEGLCLEENGMCRCFPKEKCNARRAKIIWDDAPEKEDKVMNNCEERIKAALKVAFENAGYDGEHHKMWVIDQMVRCLTGGGYEKWVKEYQGEIPSWDTGIAP